MPCQPKTRLFDPYGISGLQQDAGGYLKSLLGTVDNDDLVRLAVQRARSSEISGYGLAERFRTHRV